jgi:hypothetical protein
MTRYFRRVEPGRREKLQAGLVAGALAAAVGAVSFYFVRILLSREALEPLAPSEELDEGRQGAADLEA